MLTADSPCRSLNTNKQKQNSAWLSRHCFQGLLMLLRGSVRVRHRKRSFTFA